MSEHSPIAGIQSKHAVYKTPKLTANQHLAQGKKVSTLDIKAQAVLERKLLVQN